jgi:hypothetical protein
MELKMDTTGNDDQVLSVEVFAAKDFAGELTGIILAVPRMCGLKRADTLRIDGLSVMAMESRSVLPVDLPDLSPQSRQDMLTLARAGKRLAVAEFTALGLFDAYYLDLAIND